MARAAAEKSDRRAQIAGALHSCICRQGYASTSLTDIANEAKLSVSHVGYYFDNKAAILEYYAAGLCERILEGLPDLDEPDPERRAEAIANFCFGQGQQNRAFLGVIQEITGLAVHDVRINRIKSFHSKAWREYLEAYFENVTPSLGLTVWEAARLVHAMLVGLDTNLLFDRTMSLDSAHALLLRTLRTLSGLDEDGTREGGVRDSTREPRRLRKSKQRVTRRGRKPR
jgi:AcrR family transcriptional regulator